MSKLMLAVLVAAAFLPPPQGASGSGAPPMLGADPTPFDLFVDKLTLETKQLEDVQKIFSTAAGEAAPVSQEMIQIRMRMLAVDGKPDELAPVVNAYATAATKMTGVEVRAFQKVHELLKKNQQSKSADAFVIMAGLFNQPAPRAPRAPRGGGR